jgi:ADP-ribose pyrophosphatase YjhB (NUDIX family)
MRPGWGARHPALASTLNALTRAAVVETDWGHGTMPLRVSAYTRPAELPDELISSVRCLVIVNRHVVVCTNAGGTHPWPGGRREPGETMVETVHREVYEETGWLLEPDSVRHLGFLHFEHLSEQPDDYPYPHPDFLQVVYTGSASEPTGGRDAWTDSQGYEISSDLVSVEDVPAHLTGDPVAQLSRPFLRLL